jgi:Flp pilus assembly protein TadD
VNADPESASAQDALALALHSSGEHEAALGPAREAFRLAPDAPEYAFDLGLIEEAAGNAERARQSYRRALDLAPDFEEAREALSRLGESA